MPNLTVVGLAVGILDTLSEGRSGFPELEDYLRPDYDRDTIDKALNFLTLQSLVQVSTGDFASDSWTLDADQRASVDKFFEIAAEDRTDRVRHQIALSEKGEQVLQLLGLGHP